MDYIGRHNCLHIVSSYYCYGLERGADYMGSYIRIIWNNILGYGCYNGGLI